MYKILTVIGARPQFVKAATVSRAIERKNKTQPGDEQILEVIVHTGQHYDENLSGIFFDELKIPRPDYNLEIGSESHGRQTGRMLAEIENVLLEERPALVLTYGDTNSTLAGALAAVKLHIPTAHVEAGLRSFNRKMPEEINRIVTDEVSNILFCPTETAVANLSVEGIRAAEQSPPSELSLDSRLVYSVGDVMYDSVLFYREMAGKRTDIMAQLCLNQQQYILATVHRAENTDDPTRLRHILKAFERITAGGRRIVLPLHPRTRKMMDTLGVPPPAGVDFIAPVGYLDMVALEMNAWAIFTDSGGVQKEAFFLRVPCITLRDETEWVETVACGWNCLTSADEKRMLDAVSCLRGWNGRVPPFTINSTTAGQDPQGIYGNGHAADKIVDILSVLLAATRSGRLSDREVR